MILQALIGVVLFISLVVLGMLYNNNVKKFKYRKNRIKKIRESVAEIDKNENRFDVFKVLSKIGHLIINANIIPQKTVDEVLQSISKNPEFNGSILYIFIAAKVIFFSIGLSLGGYLFFFGQAGVMFHMVIPLALPIIGMMLPDLILSSMHKKYLAGVEKGMPQALDLLIICAESGMPVEVSMIRIAKDIVRGQREWNWILTGIRRDIRGLRGKIPLTNCGSERREGVIHSAVFYCSQCLELLG